MKLPFRGRCLCGQVAYQVSAEPIKMGFCHCRSCQKATGSAYWPFVLIKEDTFTLSGPVQAYQTIGDSGQSVKRIFCQHCGSTLCSQSSVWSGFRTVSASSLDDPSIFQPQVDIWVSEAQPWSLKHPQLNRIAGNP